MTKRRALVNMGEGFIGSNVTRFLLDKGGEVCIIDNLSSGYRKNIEGLNVDFMEADIVDAKVTRDACEDVDVVLANCLAAVSDIGTGVYDFGSEESITINRLAEIMQELSGDPMPCRICTRTSCRCASW
jgi:UDP-glucose 4-epimerase